MSKSKQQSFEQIPWRHRYSHGGSLRQERAGRSARPLSTRDSIHLVFKANRDVVRGGFRQSRRFALIHHLVQKYKFKFYVKVEQLSIQGDHLHLLIRTTRRSNYQSFFRVVAGQIAQQFEKEGLLTLSVTDTPQDVARTQAGGSKKHRRAKKLAGENSQHQAGLGPALTRKQRENQVVIDTPESLQRTPKLSDHKRKSGRVTDTPKDLALAQARRFKTRDQVEVHESINAHGPIEPDDLNQEAANPGQKTLIKLWKYRPFTRVVKSWKAYQTVRDYIQLNEKEAIGEISYNKRRLKGLSSSEWEILWT
jgi:REP element-mobilizing transposase RayT